jgi:hypothetical protein
MIGASWYMQRGEDVHATCPEALRLPSTAFLRFLGHDPWLLARALARAVPAMQGVAPPSLGTLAGTTRRGIGELPWWRGSALHALATALPSAAFASLVILSVLAASAGVLVGLGRIVARREPDAGALLSVLLGGTVLYALLTSVFGDGMSEVARHFLAGWLALAAGIIAAVVGLASWIARWRHAPKVWAVGALGLVVAAAIAAWLCLAVLAWARQQPLAFGTVDGPVGRDLAVGELTVQGWALDPSGIERLEVTLGDLRREAERQPHPELGEHYFPGYAEWDRARFRARFTAEEFIAATANGPVVVRTTATARNGVVTEIDRRTIDRARDPQAASAMTPTTEAATK